MSDISSNEQVVPSEPDGSQLSRKFFIAFAWTFGLFVILITSTQPADQWITGLIGGALFALFSGLIAMAIPTKLKIVFVPTTLFITTTISICGDSYQDL